MHLPKKLRKASEELFFSVLTQAAKINAALLLNLWNLSQIEIPEELSETYKAISNFQTFKRNVAYLQLPPSDREILNLYRS